MKTTINTTFGHSPKKKEFTDLVTALAAKDIKTALSLITDDFKWITIGSQNIITKDTLPTLLPQRADVKELIITNLVNHGKEVSCEGILHFEDGDTVQFSAFGEYNSHSKISLLRQIRFYFVALT